MSEMSLEHPFTLDEVTIKTKAAPDPQPNQNWVVLFQSEGFEKRLYVPDEASANSALAGGVLALEAAGYRMKGDCGRDDPDHYMNHYRELKELADVAQRIIDEPEG